MSNPEVELDDIHEGVDFSFIVGISIGVFLTLFLAYIVWPWVLTSTTDKSKEALPDEILSVAELVRENPSLSYFVSKKVSDGYLSKIEYDEILAKFESSEDQNGVTVAMKTLNDELKKVERHQQMTSEHPLVLNTIRYHELKSSHPVAVDSVSRLLSSLSTYHQKNEGSFANLSLDELLDIGFLESDNINDVQFFVSPSEVGSGANVTLIIENLNCADTSILVNQRFPAISNKRIYDLKCQDDKTTFVFL